MMENDKFFCLHLPFIAPFFCIHTFRVLHCFVGALGDL